MKIFAGVVAKQLLSYVNVRREQNQTPVAPPSTLIDPSTASRTGSAPTGYGMGASNVDRSCACELVEIDVFQDRESGDKRKTYKAC